MEAVRSAPARVDKGGDASASQFESMVDFMLTVGYIDGVFDRRERAYLNRYIDSVLVMVEQSAVGSATSAPSSARHGGRTSTRCITGSRPR